MSSSSCRENSKGTVYTMQSLGGKVRGETTRGGDVLRGEMTRGGNGLRAKRPGFGGNVLGAKRLVTAQCRGDPKPLFVIDRLINEHTIVVTSEILFLSEK